MGKAAIIVKLLSSRNEEDFEIGQELLSQEYYYGYILRYMEEVIRNRYYNEIGTNWTSVSLVDEMKYAYLNLRSKRQL